MESSNEGVRRPEAQLPISIRTGEEAVADLKPAELRRFSLEQAEALYQPPNIISERARDAVAALLSPTSPMRGGIRGRIQGFLNWIHPRPFHQYAELRHQWMKEVCDSGQAIVASIGDEKAGIAGYTFFGRTPGEGRDIYDVGQIVVLRKFRGRGIFPRMAAEAMNIIRAKNPDALVLVETRSDAVVKWCMHEGFQEKGVDDKLALTHPKEEITRQMRESEQRRSWRYFVYDPRERREKTA